MTKRLNEHMEEEISRYKFLEDQDNTLVVFELIMLKKKSTSYVCWLISICKETSLRL